MPGSPGATALGAAARAEGARAAWHAACKVLEPMRRLLAIGSLLLATTGCGTRVVLTVPKFPSFGDRQAAAARPPTECRYLNVLVNYSTQAEGMSARDVQLSATVAEVMKQEFARAGVDVTEEPAGAYWSLMLMAIHNVRDDGFIFSATLSLRDLSEANDPGIATYAKTRKTGPATMYTAISYGSQQDLERRARDFVNAADTALLPSARELCASEAHEEGRHQAVEAQVPDPALPL